MGESPDPLCKSLKKDGYAHCKYNTSWNWLMPVVEKIESIDVGEILNGKGQGYKNQFKIWSNACLIEPSNWGGPLIKQICAPTKIEAVYKAIVEFIKWYNDNK